VKTKFFAAQVNPFDSSVDGVKIPDSNTMQSAAVKIEDQFSVTSDANGLAVFAFMPTTVNNYIGHVPSSATAWTWASSFGYGNNSSKEVSFHDNYDLFRACAHAVRVSCSAAPTSITGNLHVCIATSTNFGATTWAFPTSIATMANCVGYRKFPLAMLTQQGVTVVNKFLDCTMTQYISALSDGFTATGTDNTKQTNGWAAIIVMIEGAPAATVILSVSEVMHLEAIPKVAALDTSTPAAPYNVEVLQQTSRLAGAISPVYTDAESPIHYQEADSLGGGMWSRFSSGVRSYASEFGGRAAYSLGRRAVPMGFAAANYLANKYYYDHYGNPANGNPRLMSY